MAKNIKIAQYSRGFNSYFTLTALLSGDKYPYQIRKEAIERSKGNYSPAESSIYTALNRLLDAGYVCTSNDLIVEEKDNGEKTKPRKYFKITQKGISHIPEIKISILEKKFIEQMFPEKIVVNETVEKIHNEFDKTIANDSDEKTLNEEIVENDIDKVEELLSEKQDNNLKSLQSNNLDSNTINFENIKVYPERKNHSNARKGISAFQQDMFNEIFNTSEINSSLYSNLEEVKEENQINKFEEINTTIEPEKTSSVQAKKEESIYDFSEQLNTREFENLMNKYRKKSNVKSFDYDNSKNYEEVNLSNSTSYNNIKNEQELNLNNDNLQQQTNNEYENANQINATYQEYENEDISINENQFDIQQNSYETNQNQFESFIDINNEPTNQDESIIEEIFSDMLVEETKQEEIKEEPINQNNTYYQDTYNQVYVNYNNSQKNEIYSNENSNSNYYRYENNVNLNLGRSSNEDKVDYSTNFYSNNYVNNGNYYNNYVDNYTNNNPNQDINILLRPTVNNIQNNSNENYKVINRKPRITDYSIKFYNDEYKKDTVKNFYNSNLTNMIVAFIFAVMIMLEVVLLTVFEFPFIALYRNILLSIITVEIAFFVFKFVFNPLHKKTIIKSTGKNILISLMLVILLLSTYFAVKFLMIKTIVFDLTVIIPLINILTILVIPFINNVIISLIENRSK